MFQKFFYKTKLKNSAGNWDEKILFPFPALSHQSFIPDCRQFSAGGNRIWYPKRRVWKGKPESFFGSKVLSWLTPITSHPRLKRRTLRQKNCAQSIPRGSRTSRSNKKRLFVTFQFISLAPADTYVNLFLGHAFAFGDAVFACNAARVLGKN